MSKHRLLLTTFLVVFLLLATACDSGDDPITDGDSDDANDGDISDGDLPDDDANDGDLDGDGDISDGDVDATDGDADGDTDTDDDAEPQAFALVAAFPPTSPAGEAHTFTFTGIGGEPPYSNWRIALGDAEHGDHADLPLGELPPGLALNADSGELSGTPSDDGFYFFVLAAEDAEGTTAKRAYGMRIGDPNETGRMARLATDFQEVYEARHLWHGFSFDCDDPDEPDGNIGLTTLGDAAFVSGNCTMAQAFRYGATRSEAAAEILKQQVEGWRFFQALTGVTGLIGRSFVHEDWPVEPNFWAEYADNTQDHTIFKGTGDYEGWYWKGDTSRDQTTGAMLGVGMAYDMADDEATREAAGAFITDMVDHILENNLAFVDPDGGATTYGNVDGEIWEGVPYGNGQAAVLILAWLKMAYHVSGEEYYKQQYDYYAYERDYIGIMRDYQWTYMGYSTKWYNTYMSWENAYHLLRLEDDPELLSTYQEIVRDTLWLNTDDSTPNRRAILEHNAVKTQWYLAVGSEYDAEAEWRVLWQLSRFPEAPLRDHAVQNSDDPDITVNPDKKDESLYALPIDRQREDMVRWHRGPYWLDGGSDAGRERTGCDYMLPYWMARYYGLVSEQW